MRITILVFISILFNFYPVQSQEGMDSLQMAVYEIHCTSDELHWKGEQYMINKSFLSIFLTDNYFQVYPMIPLASVDFEYGTAGGYTDKNFRPVWLLSDSILYLRNINFIGSTGSVDNPLPNGEIYRIMENLTKRKFRTDSDSLKKKNPPSGGFGSMRADWVTGVFYAKKIRRWEPNEESIEDWEAAPFQELTFRDGKLISVKSVKPDNKKR